MNVLNQLRRTFLTRCQKRVKLLSFVSLTVFTLFILTACHPQNFLKLLPEHSPKNEPLLQVALFDESDTTIVHQPDETHPFKIFDKIKRTSSTRLNPKQTIEFNEHVAFLSHDNHSLHVIHKQTLKETVIPIQNVLALAGTGNTIYTASRINENTLYFQSFHLSGHIIDEYTVSKSHPVSVTKMHATNEHVFALIQTETEQKSAHTQLWLFDTTLSSQSRIPLGTQEIYTDMVYANGNIYMTNQSNTPEKSIVQLNTTSHKLTHLPVTFHNPQNIYSDVHNDQIIVLDATEQFLQCWRIELITHKQDLLFNVHKPTEKSVDFKISPQHYYLLHDQYFTTYNTKTNVENTIDTTLFSQKNPHAFILK